MSALAEQAVAYILMRIKNDPRIAYHFDPITESMQLLTLAHAEATGVDVAEFRKEYYARVWPEIKKSDEYA